jgi:hypothetical protein
MGTWLDRLEASSRDWQEARAVLSEEARVRVELPSAPRELVWNEIWDWLEPRRSLVDINLSRLYRAAGRGAAWVGRRVGIGRTAEEKKDDFAAVELAALKQALAEFVDRLDGACRRGASIGAGPQTRRQRHGHERQDEGRARAPGDAGDRRPERGNGHGGLEGKIGKSARRDRRGSGGGG